MNRPPFKSLAALLVTMMFANPSFAKTQGNLDFQPIDGWGKQVYPAYLIASASLKTLVVESDSESQVDDSTEDVDSEDVGTEVLGDCSGILGIEIVSPSANAKIEVTISAEDWLAPSVINVELPEQGKTYRVMPKLKYHYNVLAKNTQTVPSTVTYKVTVNRKPLSEKTETVVLHSINDCPYAVNDGDKSVEIGFVFAAYVNEQHPFVDKILREALDSGIVDSFSGYQADDEADVLRQVYAIWHALTERDLRYSSITAVAGESDVVSSQHVRLIDESINNGQANCVDGSVLMASLLRKIDIEPWLVMVPGHCYLAFSLDDDGESIIGLETTMIGGISEGTEYETIDALDELLDEETLELDSYASFCAAIRYGTNDIEENADKFAAEDEIDYQLISISDARAQGILPIAFQSGQNFQAVK